LRAIRSVLSEEQKPSIVALSQTLPERVIEQSDAAVGHQPLELLARVSAAAVGSSASGLLRRQIATTRASVTSCAVMPALIDQPTTRRENRSMTAAT